MSGIAPSWFYPSGLQMVRSGAIDVLADPLYLMLVDCAYGAEGFEPTLSGLAANEIRGDGYTPGGKPLRARTLFTSPDEVRLHADEVVWPNSRIKAMGAILYARLPEMGNPLIGYFDLGPHGRAGNLGGSFTITFNNPCVARWPR